MLFEVAGRPVLALPGAFPAYRDLVPGVEGPDVRQLQRALWRMGYGTGNDELGVFGDGTKSAIGALGEPVRCGGVQVAAGDIVVADEDGVVVTPRDRAAEALAAARATLAREAAETPAEWEQAHRTRIERALRDRGFAD